MSKKSLDKGRRGEREIVRLFKDLWGGSPWGRRGLGHSGADIVTPDNFPFQIEVKNYDDVSLQEIIYSSKRIESWIAQAKSNTQDNRTPLLAMKAHRKWWALIPKSPPSTLQLEAIAPIIFNPEHKYFVVRIDEAFFQNLTATIRFDSGDQNAQE